MNNPFDMFDQAQAMTKMWTDTMTKMWTSGLNWSPTAPPPEAARQVRNDMFQAMSQFFDQFMRSPQTLDWMKQSMDMTMNFRKQMDEFLTRMRHQGQATTSEDIDSLMMSIRHMENRVLERLDELAERINRLGRRLEDLEESGEENGNGSSSRRMRGTRAGKSQEL